MFPIFFLRLLSVTTGCGWDAARTVTDASLLSDLTALPFFHCHAGGLRGMGILSLTHRDPSPPRVSDSGLMTNLVKTDEWESGVQERSGFRAGAARTLCRVPFVLLSLPSLTPKTPPLPPPYTRLANHLKDIPPFMHLLATGHVACTGWQGTTN